MKSIQKSFFLIAFILFELWLYCVFTPFTELPALVQRFSNQYWLLFVTAFGYFLAGIIIGIYHNPVSQKISQLEHRINNEGQILVPIEGALQILIGIGISCILVDTGIYPPKATFFLVIIWGILMVINGIRYINAPFKYQ